MAKDSRRGHPRNPGPPESARDRAREMAARRTAQLQGYRAEKSRRRDATAPDFGTWLLYGPRGGLVPETVRQVRGAAVGIPLDELERFLGIAPPPDEDQDGGG